MNRFTTVFANQSGVGRGVVIPHLVLGDPSPQEHLNVIEGVVAGGADGLLLSLPFSDPAGITPPIQAAHQRALLAEVDGPACVTLVSQIRERYPDLPIAISAFANLVVSGPDDVFYFAYAQAGVDAIVIPDVPVREGGPFCALAQANGMEQIFLAPPVGDRRTLSGVASRSGPFIAVMDPGPVEEGSVFNRFDDTIAALAALQAKPCLAMVGTATPEFAARVMGEGAAGLIGGDELTRVIATHRDQGRITKEGVGAITSLVAALKEAAQAPRP